jgi:hypothetical protein
MGGGGSIRHVANQSGFENYDVRPPEPHFTTIDGVGALIPPPILTEGQTNNPFSATLLDRDPFFVVSNFDHWLDRSLESVGIPVASTFRLDFEELNSPSVLIRGGANSGAPHPLNFLIKRSRQQRHLRGLADSQNRIPSAKQKPRSRQIMS